MQQKLVFSSFVAPIFRDKFQMQKDAAAVSDFDDDDNDYFFS